MNIKKPDSTKVKEFFKRLPITFKALGRVLVKYAKAAIGFALYHWRYFAAAVCFVLIIVVMAVSPNSGVSANDPLAGAYASYTTSKDEALLELIDNYLAAYAAGDTDTLQELATPISSAELSYITFYSQYIEEYQNVVVYTKPGSTDGSYLCSVSLEVKFVGIDTAIAGLDFFYIVSDEDDAYYISNEYGSFNQTNGEYDMDATVVSLIAAFEQQNDVISLQTEVQQACNEALLADSELNDFVTLALQELINDWATAYKTELALEEAAAALEAEALEAEAEDADSDESEEADEDADSEDADSEEAEEAEEENSTEESEETTDEATEEATEEDSTETETTETYTVYTTAKVNVRATASENGSKLGTLASGKLVTCYGTEGDWSKIDYNGTEAYVKSDYVATATSSTRSTTTNATINIRSDRSETSTKVGKASKGSTVLELYTYDDGWSKILYDGKEGYCKSQYLN